MTSRARLVTMVVVAAACAPDAGIVAVPGGSSSMLAAPSDAWLGTYEGAGDGALDGSPYTVDHARLTIRLDADGVRDVTCVRCVTIVLDTLFEMANVNPDDVVGLTARYDDVAVRRTLRLDRYSAGGQTGNVLTVRFTAEAFSGGPAGDVAYLMERR